MPWVTDVFERARDLDPEGLFHCFCSLGSFAEAVTIPKMLVAIDARHLARSYHRAHSHPLWNRTGTPAAAAHPRRCRTSREIPAWTAESRQRNVSPRRHLCTQRQ